MRFRNWRSRIGNDQFRGSINDLEISHIHVHAYKMIYSKLGYITWKNPELWKYIVILIYGFPSTTFQSKTYLKMFQLY